MSIRLKKTKFNRQCARRDLKETLIAAMHAHSEPTRITMELDDASRARRTQIRQEQTALTLRTAVSGFIL